MDSLTLVLAQSGLSSEKPGSIDLSHHHSDLANARKTSPLKGLQKYIKADAHLIMLAGGLPAPTYFPFADIGGNALVPDSFYPTPSASGQSSSFGWLWKLLGSNKEKSEQVCLHIPTVMEYYILTNVAFKITIPKYPAIVGDLSLAEALQYGPASGLRQIQVIMKEFTTKVYKPAYADFTTLISIGNTDA